MNEKLWLPLCRSDETKPAILEAHGMYLFTSNGKKLLDANSGLWNVCLGYSDDYVIEKTLEQSKKLQYVNPYEFSNQPALTLASKLLKHLPSNMTKCLFTCSGSESVELMIKFIRKYQVIKYKPNKNMIAVVSHSYHGNYYGSMSLSSYDKDAALSYGPLLSGFCELDLPFQRGKSWEEISTDVLEKLTIKLNSLKDVLAGIVIEPVLGSAGVIPLPYQWLKYISDFCQNNDILLGIDEVATGFGRTGNMFFSASNNIYCDIITMSKGINNGMLPMGALSVSKKIEDVFANSGEALFHLSTQNCNPICCVSALATIYRVAESPDNALNAIEEKGAELEKILRKSLQTVPLCYQIRRVGLMLAIELIMPNGDMLSYDTLLKIKNTIQRNGVITEWSWIDKLTSCLVLFPAYIISDVEINIISDVISNSINKVCKRILR